ncbi:MAG: hypothetical protein JOZ55_00540, partial [Alphaproteobacteria bacterium]|nr:hypothetical protein [Alphaproteobacteria bacterium]
TFTVSRSNGAGAQTLYATTVNDQNYLNRGYYNPLSAQPVSFAAGQTTATVTVTINNLGLARGSEQFRLVVTQKASDPVSSAVASDIFTISNVKSPGGGGPQLAHAAIPDFTPYLASGGNSAPHAGSVLHGKEVYRAAPSLAAADSSSLGSLEGTFKPKPAGHFGALS